MLQHIPEKIQNSLDMNSIELVSSEFTKDDLTKRLCDVIYRASRLVDDGVTGKYEYFLVEHQSTVDLSINGRLY